MNFACHLYIKRISCNCWPSKSKVIKCKFVPLPKWKDTLNATFILFILKYSSKFHTRKADSFPRLLCFQVVHSQKHWLGSFRIELLLEAFYLLKTIVFFSFSKILKTILLIHFQLFFLQFLSNRTIKNHSMRINVQKKWFKNPFRFQMHWFNMKSVTSACVAADDSDAVSSSVSATSTQCQQLTAIGFVIIIAVYDWSLRIQTRIIDLLLCVSFDACSIAIAVRCSLRKPSAKQKQSENRIHFCFFFVSVWNWKFKFTIRAINSFIFFLFAIHTFGLEHKRRKKSEYLCYVILSWFAQDISVNNRYSGIGLNQWIVAVEIKLFSTQFWEINKNLVWGEKRLCINKVSVIFGIRHRKCREKNTLSEWNSNNNKS